MLLCSGLAFFIALPYLKRAPTITLDADWVYRRALPGVIAVCTSGIERSLAAASRCARTLLARTAALIYRHHGPQGGLARTSTTRGMALWVLVLLLGYLILYFV